MSTRLPPLSRWRTAATTKGPAYFFTTGEGYVFALSPTEHGIYKIAVQGAFDATLPKHVSTTHVGEPLPLDKAFRRAASYYTYNLVRPVRKSVKREMAAGDRKGSYSSFRQFTTGKTGGTGDFVTDWIAEMEREGRAGSLRARLAKAKKKNPGEGGIPYKTWMKLIDALQRAHARGQEWIEAGRPRPSPLYDAYNEADRELLRMENEARWPYSGNAEQRKEWSYWQKHYRERAEAEGLKANPRKRRRLAAVRKRGNPRDPFAGVRRAIEKEVARFVAEGPSGFNKRGRTTWGRLMDSAYAVYEKYRVESDGAVLLPVETVTAEIHAAEERARVLRREHNEKEMREAEREYRYQQFQRDRERGYR